LKSFHELIDVAVITATGQRAGQWLGSLQQSSQHLATPSDFPLQAVRDCSAIEEELRTLCGSRSDVSIPYYQWLASGCLTTAFIMTQRDAARRRLLTSAHTDVTSPILQAMATRYAFATVGISHLTTSRRHLAGAPLTATKVENGWILNGYSPWVTGAAWADWLVLGAVEASSATHADSSDRPPEMLMAIEGNRPGVTIEPGASLIALTASSTGAVRFDDCFVDSNHVIHGPVPGVMQVSGSSGGAGGLHTSALAVGHASQAIDYLQKECRARPDLASVAQTLTAQRDLLAQQLTSASTATTSIDVAGLRKSANDLALRATQAALIAAKGAGFLAEHEVGRWCKEALFFLVWSCPQSVAEAHLCSLMTA
jgi:hypothetical protein